MAKGASAPAPHISGADLEPRAEDVVGADYTQLITARDGSVESSQQGLFDFDTRILSRHLITIDGQRLTAVSSGVVEHDRWTALLRLPLPAAMRQDRLFRRTPSRFSCHDGSVPGCSSGSRSATTR